MEDVEGVLTRDMEDLVIPDVIKDVFYPKEDTLEILCPYIYWKCVRKVGVKKGGSWEDFEGSWRETWRTGSSLTPWMTLGDPKDHILKVSCLYLYFWQRYKNWLFW